MRSPRIPDQVSDLAFDIWSITDKAQLRNLIDQARRYGKDEIFNAGFQRLCELTGVNETDPLHRDYVAALSAYEEGRSIEEGRRFHAARTHQMCARHGVQKTLERLVTSDRPAVGFTWLAERGLKHLSFEAVVVKHAARFHPEVVERATSRLAG